MKYYHKIYLLLAVLLLLLLQAPQATAIYQNGTLRAVPEQEWEELTRDEAFSYSTEKENAIAQPVQDNGLIETVLLAILAFFASPLGKFLLWALFFLLLAWILFKVFFNLSIFDTTPKKQKETPEPVAHFTDELLHADWEKRIQEAIEQKDLNLVVKYSYLRLLQLLEQRQLILYRDDKTNRDYYYELKHTDYARPFRQLTNVYEYSWYGGYGISQEQYEAYMRTFQSMKKQLGS